MKDFKSLLKTLKYPSLLVLLMWLVELSERYLLGYPLTRFGIFPRSLDGLGGIALAPLIHGDWQHILSNTYPMLVLGAIMYGFYRKVASMSIFLIWVITGFFVWLFARPSYHIGMSGVVYGMVAFVLSSGIIRKDNLSIILSLIVLILYSGFAQGLVPKEGMSHESHIIGAIIGILVANLFKTVGVERDKSISTLKREPKRLFFRPDTFERTKKEHTLNDYFTRHQLIERHRRTENDL